MSRDRRWRAKSIDDPNALPSNQRTLFLEVLGKVIKKQFGLVTELLPASRSGPVALKVSSPTALDQTVAIGCDFTEDGWKYVWYWDDDQPIARAEETARAAAIIAEVLGVTSA